MARTKVFIEIDGKVASWKTDLTGYGGVGVDEEFEIREISQYGNNKLVKGGMRFRVRVVSVERKKIGSSDLLRVDVIERLKPFRQGWGKVSETGKSHYFNDRPISMCGAVWYDGKVDEDATDNCKKCSEILAKKRS